MSYGRKRNLDGNWDELGDQVERFESQPPEGVFLSRRGRQALRDINEAAATQTGTRNSGRRITSGCSCTRCRCKGNVVALTARTPRWQEEAGNELAA